jgi:hypothetical protein
MNPSDPLAGIVSRYYKAFSPPMQVHSTDDAVAALDLIINGDKLPVGDAVILARRVKRFIQDRNMEAP